MIRKSLTILSLIGLLFSVGLWGVSYWNLRWVSSDMKRMIRLTGGSVLTNRFEGDIEYAETGLRFAGFSGMRTFIVPRYSHATLPSLPSASMRGFTLPLCIPALAFGSLFGWLFLPAHRRRKRKRLGLCLKCGYDLRGSKDRCPECGEAFKKA